MEALELPNHRKKPVTYGRTQRRHNDFPFESDSFPSSSARSSPSRLHKPSRSPARSSQINADVNNEAVFDVPSSDEEPTPKRRFPTNKTKLSRGTLSRSPTTNKIKSLGSRGYVDNAQSKRKLSANPKKRKRLDEISERPISPTPEDIDNQIDLQFQCDALHTTVLPVQGIQADSDPSSRLTRVKKEIKEAHDIPKQEDSVPLEVRQQASPGKPKRSLERSRFHHNGGTPLQKPKLSVTRSLSPVVDDAVDDAIPSTPPSQTSRGMTPGMEKKAMSTPRQSQMWRTVLGDDNDMSVKDGLENLDLVHRNSPTPRKLSDAQLSRRRLIDQLKKSRLAPDDAEEFMETEVLDDHGRTVQRSNSGVRQEDTHNSKTSSQNVGGNEIGAKITYASQRSYLQDTEMDIDTLLQQPLDPEESPAQAFQPGQTAVGSQNIGQDAELDNEEDGKPLRSIHELRAAGTSHRFASDMEALFVDLAGVPGFSKKALLSSKRTAWLELCNRLTDAEFKNRFLQGGYDHRVIDLASKETDLIISMSVAIVAAVVLENQGSHRTARQLYYVDATKVISSCLGQDRDMVLIAKDRTHNLSKMTQSTLKVIRNHLTDSMLWKGIKIEVVSPRLIALKALELMIRRLRESGGEEGVLGHSTLALVLGGLEHSLKNTNEADKSNKTYHAATIETALSLLESATVVPSCASDPLLWTTDRMRQLVSFLDIAIGLPIPNATSVDQLTLRLCLNLANNNEENSNLCARPSFIVKILSFIDLGLASISKASDQTNDSPEVNNLILSLGAMINLAEWSDDVREVTATSGSDMLTRLLKTFVESRKTVGEADSIGASRANVVYGYLAVLLANLCQNEGVRKIAKPILPKSNLAVMVEAVEEFIGHNQRADKEQGTEMWVAFTNRLQSVANILKSIET